MPLNIKQLLDAAPDEKGIDWLQRSLQLALKVELSTLPPYLCGLWSIKDESHPVRELIRSIVLQEMLHMGLACNMLTAIGGTPQILGAFKNKEIVYPGPLPGGVHPELTVYLAGLSKLYIQQVYLVIEYPEHGPVPIELAVADTHPTLGEFYDEILEIFRKASPALTEAKQLTNKGLGPGNELFVIKTPLDVERAIRKIKHQGEGTDQSPLDPESIDSAELAHYYKFAEILFEQELVKTNGQWGFTGKAVPFPPTYPMVQIPAGGYKNVPEKAKSLLGTFDQTFAEMLGSLESAWTNGNQGDLGSAVTKMLDLGDIATNIMQVHFLDSSGVYGPDFQLT